MGRLAIATSALFGLAGGIAYATIPDGAGVYTACEQNANGTLRLIDPSLGGKSKLGHCAANETQVTWNQQGQPGPAGPQGPKGDTGATGAAGANGEDGQSVTSNALAPGDDASCPNGGSKFTAANDSVTYACNGKDGSGGLDGIVTVMKDWLVYTGEVRDEVDVQCPSGYLATGGGFFTHPTGAADPDALVVRASMPLQDANGVPVGWSVIATNPSLDWNEYVHAFAVCAKSG